MTHNNEMVVQHCSIIFLAVKPQVTADAIDSIKNHLTDQHLVISVIAGITLESLEQVCDLFVLRLEMFCVYTPTVTTWPKFGPTYYYYVRG